MTPFALRTVALAAALSAFACDPSAPATEASLEPPAAAEEGKGEEAALSWCSSVGGGRGARLEGGWVGLSQVHAHARHFGVSPSHREADARLVAALRGSKTAGEALDAYARASDGDVCVSERRPEVPLSAARVDIDGDIATVHPGEGAVSFPDSARAVVIDLREVGTSSAWDEAVTRAVSRVLGKPVSAPLSRRVRRFVGHPDELGHYAGYYEAALATVEVPPVTAAAPSDRPLAFLTPRALSPEVARVVAWLRLSGRAFLVGAPVWASVAEATYFELEGRVVAVRDSELYGAGPSGEGPRWPDRVDADADDSSTLADLLSAGAPKATTPSVGARRQLTLAPASATAPSTAVLDEATLRASLLVAHGTTRLFSPYVAMNGRSDLDARLLETLDAQEISTADEASARSVLRRFAHALHDGHAWVYHPSAQGGRIAADFEVVSGFPVVARSVTPSLSPGDRVEQIDGVAADKWLAAEVERSYGATAGHRARIAVQDGLVMSGQPVEATVRDASGALRTTTLQPARASGALPYAFSTRAHGSLEDVGAPGVHYVNLDGAQAGSQKEVLAALRASEGGSGLVLDLRGHPASGGAGGYDPYAVLSLLARTSFAMPRYAVPVVARGALEGAVDPVNPTGQPIAHDDSMRLPERIALLLDSRAVSFSEDFAMMLLTARPDVVVVGETSAGTTGSVTQIELPSGFVMAFTGMDAKWPDGRALFRVGVVPHQPCQPTVASLASGRDACLDLAAARVGSGL